MIRMPVLFIGHGVPMNAIEDNEFTQNWVKIAEDIARPEAILSVSAHWYTKGTRINDNDKPRMVYDMYGFPRELYKIGYNAKGSSDIANTTKNLITREVMTDNSWGYDHGTWVVLHKMYPEADIPVIQLSIDIDSNAEKHFAIGQEIKELRQKGVLILGSGNIVHNLSLINREMEDGYSWANDFDKYIKDKIISRKFTDVIEYENSGEPALLAFYTPEHFYPLLYVLGATDETDKLSIHNDSCIMGSMSMTSYLFE